MVMYEGNKIQFDLAYMEFIVFLEVKFITKFLTPISGMVKRPYIKKFCDMVE